MAIYCRGILVQFTYKIDKLELLINKYNIDIVVFTETFLKIHISA